MKTNNFSAFIGPIITLLPSIFIASSGGGANMSFCLLTTLSLFLCYSFATNGLIISMILLLTGFYFLDLQFVWVFGVFISIFSGLIVTCYAWNTLDKEEISNHSSNELKTALMETGKQFEALLEDKKALKQQVLNPPIKQIFDAADLRKQLDEKTVTLLELRKELLTVQSKVETLKKDQKESLKQVEEKLQEKEAVLVLYKKQETELLSLLKKESQIPTE